MTSSSWHGVTTVLMGNCGVTFAPVAKGDEQFLAEMMESVEDIPRDAILNGLAWDWETYPEYLDSVEKLNPALNIVGMVGHCAVRYNVMGERSLSDEPATAQELQRMSDIVAESVAGGAVGFSTSRILLHVVPDGRYVPGTLAPKDEYLAIADGLNAGGGGIFQAVNDFATKAAHEFDLLQSMSEACGDVLFSGGVGNGDKRSAEGFGQFLNNTRANAGRITSAGMTRPGGSLCGLAQISPVKGKKRAAGNLGSALASFAGFRERGFEVVGVVDVDPQRIGREIGGLVVGHEDELAAIVADRDVAIGVIAVPPAAAQEATDRLVECGVRSILNFAPTVLDASDEVQIRNVDLAIELQILAFHEGRRSEGGQKDESEWR
jgi:hypothetical protein